jgi:hypothetical protein
MSSFFFSFFLLQIFFVTYCLFSQRMYSLPNLNVSMQGMVHLGNSSVLQLALARLMVAMVVERPALNECQSSLLVSLLFHFFFCFAILFFSLLFCFPLILIICLIEGAGTSDFLLTQHLRVQCLLHLQPSLSRFCDQGIL